jgi:hypothetical protein
MFRHFCANVARLCKVRLDSDPVLLCSEDAQAKLDGPRLRIEIRFKSCKLLRERAVSSQ